MAAEKEWANGILPHAARELVCQHWSLRRLPPTMLSTNKEPIDDLFAWHRMVDPKVIQPRAL